MINSNELRIGNLFNERFTNTTIEVESISKNVITFSGDFKNDWQAEPIPLTEEWLLRVGFEFRNTNKQYGWFLEVSQNRVLNWCHSKEISLEFDKEDYDYNNTLFDFKCEFVHQLQNLYYALTGKELTLK